MQSAWRDGGDRARCNDFVRPTGGDDNGLNKQDQAVNVRELENVVRRALVTSHGIISLSALQEVIPQENLGQLNAPFPNSAMALTDYVSDLLVRVQRGEIEYAQVRMMETAERELYGQAIKLAGGDQSKACKWLGVSRPTMREKLLRYGLHPAQECESKVERLPFHTEFDKASA